MGAQLGGGGWRLFIQRRPRRNRGSLFSPKPEKQHGGREQRA
jgi:hypothetical protein